MRCDQCGEREAVFQLTQVANDQMVTLHLCERCAAEKGVESTMTLGKTPMGSFLASMGKALEAEVEQGPEPRPDRCASCGSTLSDFRETGRLGCAECYRTFEAPLRELLRRLHGSSRHLGERYLSPEAEVVAQVAPSNSQLREQLRLAIEMENFELAAEIRDQLRLKESGIGGDS